MALFRSIGAGLDDDGAGTEPVDVRKGLAGLFSGPGVLPGYVSPLVQGTDGFEYQVNAAHWVTSRGGSDGVHLWGNDGPVTVSTDVAPGAGLSRIDIIYALHPSAGENGDTTSQPVVAVAQGVAASSPAAPSLPVGALELARNTMTSAATSTASAGNTIAQTADQVALPVPDTGPVDVTPVGDWSAGARVRRIGQIVTLEGFATGTIAANTTVTVATIPVGYRPTVPAGMVVSWITGEVGFGRVMTDGAVQVRKPTAGTSTVYVTQAWAL